MAVNKVTFNTANGERTLIDLTGDTATVDAVFEGAIFHGADGEVKTGSFTISQEISEQDDLISQIRTALAGKATGGGAVQPTQRKTVNITANGTTYVAPDDGFVLSGVTARVDVPIPEGYIQPSGTREITTNGTHDVKAFESVNVNVPVPDGYIKPSGTKLINANGTYDVTDKAEVLVNVPEREIRLQDIEIAENGTYSPDAGYDGFGQVIVNVPNSGGSTEPDYYDLYQRVEYIESAEEETYPYIITDFYGDNTSGMEIVASFPVLRDRIPMGSREDSGTTRFYCVYPMSANSIYYGFNTGSSVSCALKVDTIYRLQTNFLNSRLVNVYDKNGIYKGGAYLSATLTTQTAPVSIFGYHSAASGAVTSKREFKLYSARCSKNHEVVREYIPCCRKSDGAVGLYEKFTGQFLLPETGSFTKGADVEW